MKTKKDKLTPHAEESPRGNDAKGNEPPGWERADQFDNKQTDPNPTRSGNTPAKR